MCVCVKIMCVSRFEVPPNTMAYINQALAFTSEVLEG